MKYIFNLFTVFIFFNCAPAQQTGSKVRLTAVDGKIYTGIITEIQGDKYKVKYDGFDFDAWLMASQFTVVNANPPAPNIQNQVAGKFKPGDRVEVDKARINSWEKGTVMPYLKSDTKDGSYYRVRLDEQARNGMYLDGLVIPANSIRISNAPTYQQEKPAVNTGKVTVDEYNTVSADRPILPCPVQQSPVSNTAKPNLELFKKIIRCIKGEKPTSKGLDGAVTVDVTSIQLGTPRKWQYIRDIGGGPGVTIYPVKVTFTSKTFYRTKTEVSENWIRIINFFVNEFGEWTPGSEESIKAGETKNILRD